MKERTYICIDLKSFYASVECVERSLNPLTTNLVVADISRTEKTICLAVSPSLKSYGVSSRPRLFEVIQKVKEVNDQRRAKASNHQFKYDSFDSRELESSYDFCLTYITAIPQMAKYIQYSTRIYDIYLRYVSHEDIHVYSIDEVFMDITDYLKASKKTPYEFTMSIIKDVLKETKITATAGIGTNMYLAKVAMDIVAKKKPADSDGVRIAYLDEKLYREELWNHTPLTDFWRVGPGYVRRLESVGLKTMGDVARCSLGKETDFYNEDLLYKIFGINAELLIDHAWGYEPTLMEDVKNYRPISNSVSCGQVLHSAYTYKQTLTIIKEMAELLSLDLVKKRVLTDQLVMTIGYDIKNPIDDDTAVDDFYGRKVPKSDHGSINMKFTSSTTQIMKNAEILYRRIANPRLMIRRLNICASHVISEENYNNATHYEQLDLFTDYNKKVIEDEKEQKQLEKEKNAQKAILNIKNKYGKNAVLKGMNLYEEGTTKDRNTQIGGHKA